MIAVEVGEAQLGSGVRPFLADKEERLRVAQQLEEGRVVVVVRGDGVRQKLCHLSDNT
ncbi:hypothetical protein GTW78_29895 [Streptomyces sp. SID4948]|nr:hypothetical protein [Streptomyces sp. SID4948]